MTPTPPPSGPLRMLATIVRASRLWQWLLLVLTLIVLYLALSPSPPHQADLGWDKLNHTAAFAALTFSGWLGFPASRRTVLLVLVGMLALGGLIEVAQAYVPGRDSDWHDVIADAVGMAVGGVLAYLLLKLARTGPGSAPAQR